MEQQPGSAAIFLRRTAANGVIYYLSPALQGLGIRHLFTSRQGGVSKGGWDSLNLGEEVGDDPACVAENWRRVRAVLGVAEVDWGRVQQVHGGTVAMVLRTERGEGGSASLEADALVTAVPGVALSVQVADCLPLLVADRRGRAVAAIHGGWRSLAAGIVAHTFACLAQVFKVAARDCWAALGPAIGPCCFEVGSEVAAEFAAWGGGVVGQSRRGRLRVDLGAVARLQLQAAGVPAEQIEGGNWCTACHPEEFFSHRRDRGQTGRLGAAIVCPGAPINAPTGPGGIRIKPFQPCEESLSPSGELQGVF